PALPLGSDATGAGLFQLAAGANIEQLVGRFIVSGSAAVGLSPSRTVGELTEQLGPQLTIFGAFGYILDETTALALTLATAQSFDASLNGQRAAGTARGLTTLGLTFGHEFEGPWRVQGALLYDLPWLGRNRSTGIAASFMVLYSWS